MAAKAGVCKMAIIVAKLAACGNISATMASKASHQYGRKKKKNPQQ
jgi:hypothetical protein